MKRVIPVLVVILLMCIIMVAGPGRELIERFRYSDERADLGEYFRVSGNEAPIIFGTERIEEKAIVEGGEFYLPLALVKERLNKHFYLDISEGLLLFTNADTTYAVKPGAAAYYEYGSDSSAVDMGREILKMGDEPLLSLSFVKRFTNFYSETYEDPYRLQIFYDPEPMERASILKNTQIRYQGGVKSDILREVEKGDEVIILEEMETWTKVMYEAFIGYVENKRLSDTNEYNVPEVHDYAAPEFTHIAMEEKVCLGWHQVGGDGGNSTLSEMTRNTQGMNVISPTWFSLSDNNGSFKSISSTQYVTEAHRQGLQVWGLIDNFDPAVDSFMILSRTSVRRALVDNLMQAAAACGMDGINIDFEQLAPETGEHFAQFIRELSVECRKEGLILSVDNYVPQGGTDFYRRDVQGEYADYVIIMGYDEHWAGCGEAGSVASIDYVDTGIAMTLKQVPPERIVNGVPFYTRVWITDGSGTQDQALGMADAEEFLARNGAKTVWDEVTCQNLAEFKKGDSLYQVWMEDEQSLEVKLNIMNNYGLAGMAAWKLGFEKPSVWNVIDGYLHG